MREVARGRLLAGAFVLAALGVLGAACTIGQGPAPVPTVEIDVQQVSSDAGLTGEVVRVVDGDTIEVLFSGGATERVRLIGVDVPEIFSDNNPGEYGDITDTECLRDWGMRATEFATGLVSGREVRVFVDLTAGVRDRFGRMLAYVEVGGDDLGAALVSAGMARVYAEGVSSREPGYLALQSEAAAAGAGLWGDCGG